MLGFCLSPEQIYHFSLVLLKNLFDFIDDIGFQTIMFEQVGFFPLSEKTLEKGRHMQLFLSKSSTNAPQEF